MHHIERRTSMLLVVLLAGQVAAAALCEATCISRVTPRSEPAETAHAPGSGCHLDTTSSSANHAVTPLPAHDLIHCAHPAGTQARIVERQDKPQVAGIGFALTQASSTITNAACGRQTISPACSPLGTQVRLLSLRI